MGRSHLKDILNAIPNVAKRFKSDEVLLRAVFDEVMKERNRPVANDDPLMDAAVA